MNTKHSLRGNPEPLFPAGKGQLGMWSPGDPAVEAYGELIEQFYQDNLEFRPEDNTLILHFSYPYEVDLDRIKSERDLLNWVLHFCQKTWMTTEHIYKFAEKVAKIKKFTIHD
jgi:hypothetical protein